MLGGIRNLITQAADLLQIGQVREHRRGRLTTMLLGDLDRSAVQLAPAAAMQYQSCAFRGEPVGQGAAEAVGSARDEDRACLGHVLLLWTPGGRSQPLSPQCKRVERAEARRSKPPLASTWR
jgi:hypothetical protein